MRSLVPGALAFLLMFGGCGPTAFDRARWASGGAAANVDNPRDWENPRATMIDEAQRAGVSPGAQRAFVHDLLGSPDAMRGNTDIYVLGASPYGVDYDGLGVVASVRVIQG